MHEKAEVLRRAPDRHRPVRVRELGARHAACASCAIRTTGRWARTASRCPISIRVTFEIIPDDATRILKLKSGELGGAEFIPFARVAELDADPNIDMQLFPSTRVTYLTMNVRPELIDGTPNPLSDAKVRQALNYAIDKDAIIQIVTYGVGTKSQSYMSSTTPMARLEGPALPLRSGEGQGAARRDRMGRRLRGQHLCARRQCRRDRDRFGGPADVEPARRQAQHRAGRQRHPHRALPGRRLPDAQLALDQRHQRSEPDHLVHRVLPADRIAAFRLEQRRGQQAVRAEPAGARPARRAPPSTSGSRRSTPARRRSSTCTRRPIRWRCRRTSRASIRSRSATTSSPRPTSRSKPLDIAPRGREARLRVPSCQGEARPCPARATS